MFEPGKAIAVSLNGVEKRYGRTTALRPIDLHVKPGEFVSLLGPSGSGKTTILNLVSGYLAPDSGMITLDGKDAARMTPAQRGIGVVFQHYALFPHMSVGDNIAYGLRRRRWPRAEIAVRVTEMLELVGLAGFGERRPSQLSGGQQQRVALARALAFRPGLLLMDEPLAALDREIRVQMRSEVRRIHRTLKPTIIYVTHDRDEAFALSDRVVIMRAGGIVRTGDPVEIYDDPRSAFVAKFYSGFEILNVEVGEPAANGRRSATWLGMSGTPAAASVAEGDRRFVMTLPADAIRIDRSGDNATIIDLVIMGGNAMVYCETRATGEHVRVEVPGPEAHSLKAGMSVGLSLDFSRAALVSASDDN